MRSFSMGLSAVTLISTLIAFADAPSAQEHQPFDHTYHAYGELLTRFVRAGRVDYAGLLADRSGLDRVVNELAGVSPGDEEHWPRAERLALWINVYNLITLRSIVDRYPIRAPLLTVYPRNSIRQIDGVWTVRKWQAGGRSVTLDQIEHGILRPGFKDPRVHFATNCASKSCPPLRFEPYRGRDIDAQLDDATRRFLASPEGVQVAGNRLLVSSLFKWYGSDFVTSPEARGAANGTADAAIRAFIVRYGPPAAVRAATSAAYIRFLSYDWSLNDIDPGRP